MVAAAARDPGSVVSRGMHLEPHEFRIEKPALRVPTGFVSLA
jgi:hypothetical protein